MAVEDAAVASAAFELQTILLFKRKALKMLSSTDCFRQELDCISWRRTKPMTHGTHGLL